MSNTPQRDRLEKLLRLACNNPNKEEARSAALKFCKMFMEAKAQISLPGDTPKAPQMPHFTPPPQNPHEAFFGSQTDAYYQFLRKYAADQMHAEQERRRRQAEIMIERERLRQEHMRQAEAEAKRRDYDAATARTIT